MASKKSIRRSKSKKSKRAGKSRSSKSINGMSASRVSFGGKGASVQGLSLGPGAGGAPPAGVFGEQPQQVKCPQCNNVTQTAISYTPGMCTYILCVISFPCCWIPFLTDYSKDVEHRCSVCGYYFGKYNRLNM